jgi:hypothetical protein
MPVSVIPAHRSTCYGCARLPTGASDSRELLLSWGGDGCVRSWDMTTDYTLPAPPVTMPDDTVHTAGNGNYSNSLGELSLNPTKGNQRTSVYTCCVEPPMATAPPTRTDDGGPEEGFLLAAKLKVFCGVSDATATFMGTPIPILEVDVD